MRDFADSHGPSVIARLVRGLNEEEARTRNALSLTQPGLRLVAGDVVTVVDRFEQGASFLVEFRKSSQPQSETCDWMGVLRASDVEFIGVSKVTD